MDGDGTCTGARGARRAGGVTDPVGFEVVGSPSTETTGDCGSVFNSFGSTGAFAVLDGFFVV